MATTGDPYPTVVTLVIAAILSVWSLSAISGAGAIQKLPLLRFALCAITGVYILRGVAFVSLAPCFPGNTFTFWIVSSSICVAFGILYLVGLRQIWSRLFVGCGLTPHSGGRDTGAD